ncbi:TPA: hypothetical protein ACH3X1_007021 [Trebouxia sp. C0004]
MYYLMVDGVHRVMHCLHIYVCKQGHWMWLMKRPTRMLHVSISDHNDKTSNSLTGASASSSGAIHYASALPPSNPMPLARPRAHGSMKVSRKSKYALGVFKAHLRSVALGRTKGTYKHKGHRKSHKKHTSHHRHKAGTTMGKKTAYCKRSYHK